MTLKELRENLNEFDADENTEVRVGVDTHLGFITYLVTGITDSGDGFLLINYTRAS